MISNDLCLNLTNTKSLFGNYKRQLGVPELTDYVALTKEIVKDCSKWFERTPQGPLASHRTPGTSCATQSEYIGVYRYPISYAVISITIEDQELFFHRGGLASQNPPLEHYHYETFSFAATSYDEHIRLGLIDSDTWEQLLIAFERGIDGNVIGAKWLLDKDLLAVCLKKVQED